MAKKLPFIVQPRLRDIKVKIGNEDSGVIEIERRGYLTVAEKFYVNQATGNDKTIQLILDLSNKLAKKLKKQPAEAYNIVSDYFAGKLSGHHANMIENDFGEELKGITAEITKTSSIRELAQATTLIQSRIDPEWQIEDTMKLHPDIMQDLCKFYMEEERKEYPDLEAVEKEEVDIDKSYEAALGK